MPAELREGGNIAGGAGIAGDREERSVKRHITSFVMIYRNCRFTQCRRAQSSQPDKNRDVGVGSCWTMHLDINWTKFVLCAVHMKIYAYNTASLHWLRKNLRLDNHPLSGFTSNRGRFTCTYTNVEDAHLWAATSGGCIFQHSFMSSQNEMLKLHIGSKYLCF